MKSDRIADIRGIGLMLAVELRQSSPALADIAFENGLLINIIQGKIIRLLPALNISRKMIDNMVEKLEYILGTLQ
jgi:acetylornithine/N-succinyldiaminopimelate aminotransferase